MRKVPFCHGSLSRPAYQPGLGTTGASSSDMVSMKGVVLALGSDPHQKTPNHFWFFP